jgi:hypothetical protein
MKRSLLVFLGLAIICLACSPGGEVIGSGYIKQRQLTLLQNRQSITSGLDDPKIPPVYVTVALHIEDVPYEAKPNIYFHIERK